MFFFKEHTILKNVLKLNSDDVSPILVAHERSSVAKWSNIAKWKLIAKACCQCEVSFFQKLWCSLKVEIDSLKRCECKPTWGDEILNSMTKDRWKCKLFNDNKFLSIKMKSLTLLTSRRRSTHLSNSFEVLDDVDNDGFIFSDKMSTPVIDF